MEQITLDLDSAKRENNRLSDENMNLEMIVKRLEGEAIVLGQENGELAYNMK